MRKEEGKEPMKTIEKVGAQGDVFLQRVERIPKKAKPVVGGPGQPGVIVLAHSETGHHHLVQADGVVLYEGPKDPFTCYLRVDGEYADIVHHRPFDAHETIRITRGTWLVRRQREYTPTGFQRVED